MNDQEIEKEIQEKQLNAPRLTLDLIDSVISNEQYHVFEGTTVTICCLTLNNGYNVIGESSAVSLDNFNQDIGRKVSKENAQDKIWALEGYLLKQRLFEAYNV
jgi:hypothetical protein